MAHTFTRGVVPIWILSVALAMPAGAQNPRTLAPGSGSKLEPGAKDIVIGAAVGIAAVAVVATVLIIHYSHKKSSWTGCVVTGANGMSLTNEKDKQTYLLFGDTSAVKSGDRMTLHGKRKNTGNARAFETQKVTRDFGVCSP